MSNMFTYELDIDMKQEFQMGFDTEAHQLDTMILKCYMYNEGVPLDTTNYNVEFRAKKPDGTDYIQRKYGIEKGIGYININCTDELTVISGMCKAELRIWNGTLQQSTSRIINIGIIPSVLEVDRTISKSTITELQYVNSTLDSLNESLEEAEVFVSQHGDIVNLDSRVSNIEIDSTRTTISKAVTGAINELNANKANQSDLDNTNNNVSLKANATQVYTKNETDSIATNLRSKNTQITMNDLAQDVKTAMTGGNVAVVGEGAVQTINVIDKAITSVKRTVLGEFAQISTKSTPVAISETNKTLTFVDTSFNVLSYRNTNVFIPANTSIDITGNNSSASIYFDTVSSSFIVKEVTGVTITEHCIRIGIIWWVDGKITSIFGNFDYTINGRTKDRYWLQKYNNQMLYGYIMMNDGVAVIDTTAKTLILPNSNMYLLYGGSYVSLVSFKGMSIDITGNGTHCKLYYDLISNAFSTSAPTKLSVDWVTDKVFLGMIDLSIPQNSHLRFNFTIKSLPFLDSRWAGRTINCLGDSITYGAGGTSWTVSLPKLLKATVNNYGVSGTGIINNGINSFLQRYSNMVNADLICVWGGVNDHHWRDDPAVYSFGDMTSTSDKSFYGALKQLCEGLINKYPTSSIMFITPMKNAGYISGTTSTPNWNQTNRLGKTLTDYRNAIIQVCDYYSIPVLDFYAMSGISPMVNNQSTAFLVDGLHPNAEGNVKLSSKIASFMNNL